MNLAQDDATGIMRRIWAAIKARDGIPEAKRTPYFMVVDEFDDVVSEDANVDKMLSKARSMRMSVILANQQPSQLPESIQKAIFGNCDNLLALNPNEPADARIIMKRFGDYTTEDLLNLGRFKLFTRIMVNAERSDPFISHTFPVYPPLRSRAGAQQVIARSLDRYGVERLDSAEITNDLIIGDDDQEQDLPGPEEVAPSIKRQRTILEAIFTARIQNDHESNWVAAEAVREEFATRIPDLSTSQVSNLIEQLPEDLVKVARRDGTTMLKLTPAGQASVFTQDTGSSASGGGVEHRVLLRRVFEVFTQLGFTVEIPRQEGRKQPDGVANLPINPQSESLAEARGKEQQLKEEYPTAYAISGGRNLTIEAATTTLKKPKQPLTNLQKALEADRKCVFAVMDGESTHGSFAYWAERGERILTEPPFVRNVDADGNRTFYNAATQLEVEDGVYALRPADARQAVWEEDGSALVLRDGNGTEQARFSDFEQLASPSRDDVPATYTYEGGQFNVQTETGQQTYSSVEALKADWTRIRRPFIPELEFPREPTDDDWMFIVFPDDDKNLPPQIYEDGELRPLFPTDDNPNPEEEQAETPGPDPHQDQTLEPTDRKVADQDEAECEHGNDPETCIWCNS